MACEAEVARAHAQRWSAIVEWVVVDGTERVG